MTMPPMATGTMPTYGLMTVGLYGSYSRLPFSYSLNLLSYSAFLCLLFFAQNYGRNASNETESRADDKLDHVTPFNGCFASATTSVRLVAHPPHSPD